MKTTDTLITLGFELDANEENLYIRKAEDGNHDVIKFMPADELYNVSIVDKHFDFVNEKQLLAILASQEPTIKLRVAYAHLSTWEVFKLSDTAELTRRGIQIGRNVTIATGVAIGDNVSIGKNTSLSKNVQIFNNTQIGNGVTIEKDVYIGGNTSIGNNVHIGCGTDIAGKLTIKDNVGIGANVEILGVNLTIEKNAKICKNVVIRVNNTTIPPYVIIPSDAKISNDNIKQLIGNQLSIQSPWKKEAMAAQSKSQPMAKKISHDKTM